MSIGFLAFLTYIRDDLLFADVIFSVILLLTVLAVIFVPISIVEYLVHISSGVRNWVAQPDLSNNKLAQSLNADYINQSVQYSIRRLGDESYSPAYPPEYETGLFKIDGKHLTLGNFAFSADDIQWFGRYKKSSSVRLSLNIDGWWYRLSINPTSDEKNFYEELLKRIPDKLKRSNYINRPDISSGQGTMANIAHQNLQGIFEDHEAVELFVTPLWLVVLHNGTVIEQYPIDDINDIRSTKHPMHINDDMQLLTFEIGDKALMFSHMDNRFVTRLSDASRSGFDSSAMRKKKQSETTLN